MLDADVNTLTFHNMDQLYDTRTVGRSGPIWVLPKVESPMAFTYAYDGGQKPAGSILEDNRTNALLIIKNGRIVTEIYRNRTSEKTRFMSWSMAKSITATLVGLALSEGRIASLDDPLTRYLPELKGGGYEGVTIRQTLQMRSGVDYEERYDFENPGIAATVFEQVLVKNQARFADFAAGLKRKHKPGEVFEYKTIDTAVLGWLVERATGSNASTYLASRIWEPMGAEADGFFIMDGPPGVGREFTGAGYNATLRDYGRFGLLMLQDGVANGRRLVPAEWVREAAAPALGQEGERGGYGYQWWTMSNSPAYYALGLQGQFIYVDPATQTVVVKLSYHAPGDPTAVGEALSFMSAASAWRP